MHSQLRPAATVHLLWSSSTVASWMAEPSCHSSSGSSCSPSSASTSSGSGMSACCVQWCAGCAPCDQQCACMLLRIAPRRRYDACVHMVTAAIGNHAWACSGPAHPLYSLRPLRLNPAGAEQYYTLENNAARTETAEEAAAQDHRVRNAWLGTMNMHVIGNETGFESKIQRVLSAICAHVGVPRPRGARRYFKVTKRNDEGDSLGVRVVALLACCTAVPTVPVVCAAGVSRFRRGAHLLAELHALGCLDTTHPTYSAAYDVELLLGTRVAW